MRRHVAVIGAALVAVATLGTDVADATGAGWAIQRTPSPVGAIYSVLSGVSCTAATACTAVGDYLNSSGTDLTLAERSSGTNWAIQPTPSPAGATISVLRSVSCTATTVCTAVGDYRTSSGTHATLAERWNGSNWAIQPTASPAGAIAVLDGVSCTAATACTAVGLYYSSSNTDLTLAERWNGSNWAIQPTPNPVGATITVLRGVSCTAATACTAVGDYHSSSGTDLMLAERWDGTSWAIQPTPSPAGTTGGSLSGVFCTLVNACTAVGDYRNSSGLYQTLAEHWNGASWSIESTPNRAGARGNYLLGVSCTAAAACTAVGSYLNSSSTYPTLTERWNGTSWAIQPQPQPRRRDNHPIKRRVVHHGQRLHHRGRLQQQLRHRPAAGGALFMITGPHLDRLHRTGEGAWSLQSRPSNVHRAKRTNMRRRAGRKGEP